MSIINCGVCENPVDTDFKMTTEVCEACTDRFDEIEGLLERARELLMGHDKHETAVREFLIKMGNRK